MCCNQAVGAGDATGDFEQGCFLICRAYEKS